MPWQVDRTEGTSDQVHTTGFSRVALSFYLDEQGGVYQVKTTGFSSVEVQLLPILRPKLKGHATKAGGLPESARLIRSFL
jgi:hypothetical protein